MTSIPVRHPFTLFRVRPLLMIPFFGVLLIAAMWTAVWYQLAIEQRAVLAAAMRDTESFAAAFEQHTLRCIRDADRTLLFVRYEIESYRPHGPGADDGEGTDSRRRLHFDQCARQRGYEGGQQS